MSDRRAAPRAPLDPSVRALGVVSLFNDISSEVTIRTLPLFLANVLGVKPGVIGLIEGIGESTSTLLKLVSGSLTDRFGRRKPLALAGYAVSGFSKPLLYFATSWWWVLAVRFLDRVGKGVRTPPRDALMADLVAVGERGRAFGFNKAMDKVGAVVGLLTAAGVLYTSQQGASMLTREGYQSLVLLPVVPGVLSVFVLARFVKEPTHEVVERTAEPTNVGSGPQANENHGAAPLGGRFWTYLAILVVFSLGNSSDAFLMLRAQTVGLSTFAIFLVTAGFSAMIALSSTHGGAWSDRWGRKRLIVTGWLIYAAIYFGFAAASLPLHVAALYAGYGLYYGAFQGASTALVADLVPAARRGAAYGLFNAALGVAALPASVIAGVLWQRFGPPAPFIFGGALALLAAVMLVALPTAGVSTPGTADQR